MRRLTDEQIAEIRRLRGNHLSVVRVAGLLGVSTSSVSKYAPDGIVSERATGWRHSESTRQRMGVARAATAARNRAAGFPSEWKCPRCRKVKRTGVDFYWRKQTLVSGEVIIRPYSYCKECQRTIVAENRVRVGPVEMRRRRAGGRRSKDVPIRVSKGPFLEWFRGYLDSHRSEFLVETKMTGQGVGRKMRFDDGMFDVAAFCLKAEITRNEYALLQRYGNNPAALTISFDLVERILIALGFEELRSGFLGDA